eukprot:gene14201-16326_t
MSSTCSSDWEALPPREKKKKGETMQIDAASAPINSSDWEALPPREKKKKDDCSTFEKDQSIVSPEPVPIVGRTKVAKHQQILDNIEARKQITHNISTLQSKDGRAGQYYEYLDHTADVQCHAWGATMKEAFQNMAPCMMNYMTDLTLVNIDPGEPTDITIEAHDLQSLLYNFMNEILFKFSSDSFCTVKADITEFDENTFSLKATLYGEFYYPNRHSSGTEIKAITYSNLQIHQSPTKVDLYVIVDI